MVARLRSGLTSTRVTVTNPTRGSFSRGISSARTSRNSSATLSGRAPPPMSALASVVGSVQRKVDVDDLDLGPSLDVAFDLVHDPLEVVGLAGDGRHCDGRPLPQVLMVDLGDGHVELLSQRRRE